MTTTTRTPHTGYRAHDGRTPWQECDTCYLRTGEGITTAYDAAYYAGDPAVCPRCGGQMCLPATYRIDVRVDGAWEPAPGESTGLTREMAERMVDAGIPTMDGSEAEWDDVRIVVE